MRIWKFTKIDLMRCRRHLWILLFPAVSAGMMITSKGNPENHVYFGMAYCLFAGIFLAATPFQLESSEEKGFLQMLPARPGEPVIGHFLFGLLSLLLTFFMGILSVEIARLFNPLIPSLRLSGSFQLPFSLLLGTAMLFTGLEDILLSIFRFKQAGAMQLVRMMPPFIFFFGMNFLQGVPSERIEPILRHLLKAGGMPILLICVILYVITALIASRICILRGEA